MVQPKPLLLIISHSKSDYFFKIEDAKYLSEILLAFSCDPGGIRTHDPQLRRLLLYPTELPGQNSRCKCRKISDSGKFSSAFERSTVNAAYQEVRIRE
jgi:hypothetical protein